MANKIISKTAVFLFILAGLLGLVVTGLFYYEVFPEASIDLKLSKEEIVAKSRAFLLENRYDLAGYRAVAVFSERRDEIDFLERHLGLKAANQLFRNTIAVWRWKVRWFKVLEEVEYSVEYTPDGRLVGFYRKLPESFPGQRLDKEEGRRIAETFLHNYLGSDLSRYQFIGRSGMQEQPKRLDQSFVWRSIDFGDIGGSQHRITVAVQGDRVGYFSQWLKIPEKWALSQHELWSKRSILVNISNIPIIILYLALIVAFLLRAHTGDIRWRWAFIVGGVYGLIVLLTQYNRLPFAYITYNTAKSLITFWIERLLYPLLPAMLSFLGAALLLSTATATGKKYLEGKFFNPEMLRKNYPVTNEAGKEMVMGYGMAFASIGYVIIFYIAGQKYFGAWSPIDLKFSNDFSTYIPFFTAFNTGLSAAFKEELLFRLFAIALMYRLTGRMWPSIIVPALVWGFAHSTYPQEPVWIRGLELTISGTVFGWVFLRYGLITTIISHYLYNVFIGVLPQLNSGQPYLIVSGLLPLIFPFLFFVLLRLWRRLTTKEHVERERAPEALTPAEDAGEENRASIDSEPAGGYSSRIISRQKLACYVLIAAGIFSISFLPFHLDFFGKAPSVKLTREDGARMCREALHQLGLNPKGYSSFTDYLDDTYSLPVYVISRYGFQGTWERFRNYYGYSPQWVTYWYKEKTVKCYRVSVDEMGQMVDFGVTLEEAEPGVKLDEPTAKKIAQQFITGTSMAKNGVWQWIETNITDHPNRLDYTLTYRDSAFKGGDLQRRLSVVISGDKVTGLGSPYYNVPEDWTRKNALLKNSFRNTTREFIATCLLLAILIFLIVQIVILFRQRNARRQDVTRAFLWSVLLGAIPSLVGEINKLPSFYHGYYFSTESSMVTYTITKTLGLVGEFIWMPALMFLLILLVPMVTRAWLSLSRKYEFQTLLDTLRPKQWGSRENFYGVILGVATWAFFFGLDWMEEAARALFNPEFFAPSALTTDISVNQVSELLNLAQKIPQLVLLSLGGFMVFAAMRRFLKKEVYWLSLPILLILLATGTESASWKGLVIDCGLTIGSFLVFYYVITRILRLNYMAYLVWIWIELNSDAIFNFKRLTLSMSPAFFWPSVAQIVALVLPISIVLIYGFFRPPVKAGEAT